MNQALFFISKSPGRRDICVVATHPSIMKYIFFLLLLGIFSTNLNAQISLSDFNLAHKYDPESEISLINNLKLDEDSLVLRTELTLYQDKSDISDFLFSFYLVNAYTQKLEEEISEISIDSTYIGKRDNQHFLLFKIPRVYGQNLLVMKVISQFTGYQYYFDVPLADNMPVLIRSHTDAPIMNTWLNPGRYKTSFKEQQLISFYYNHEFPVARPPMVTASPAPSKVMNVDSIFNIQNDETFILKGQGLYLMQTDTSSGNALSVRVENKYFPKPAKLDQLVDPLIYITTKDEKKYLESAREEKAKFDQFWIELTRSSERARDIIKTYYDRVEEANRLFTTYKPGWKNDMGMIYIVFGPPDRVFRTNNGEKWMYLANRDLKKLEFSFVKASSIFSKSHYVLIRDRKYTDSWYRAISLIRQGRFQ